MEKYKDKLERLERPEPDFCFSEATINDFMGHPIWKAIEELWKQQRAVAIDLVMQSRGEDDEFFKGVVDQINYNLRLREILMEDNYAKRRKDTD